MTRLCDVEHRSGTAGGPAGRDDGKRCVFGVNTACWSTDRKSEEKPPHPRPRPPATQRGVWAAALLGRYCCLHANDSLMPPSCWGGGHFTRAEPQIGAAATVPPAPAGGREWAWTD